MEITLEVNNPTLHLDMYKNLDILSEGAVREMKICDLFGEHFTFIELKSNLAGEIYHGSFDSTVSLSKVSHINLSLSLLDGRIFCKIKVLQTPEGRILESLFNEGIKLYLRERIVGKRIITFDVANLDEVI